MPAIAEMIHSAYYQPVEALLLEGAADGTLLEQHHPRAVAMAIFGAVTISALSYLVTNLASRGPASIEVMTMFRKPEAVRNTVSVKYVGFDIPSEFVVGYGLDYDGRYRNLRSLGTLAPHVYS